MENDSEHANTIDEEYCLRLRTFLLIICVKTGFSI